MNYIFFILVPHAYLDPGSGSILIQLILAAFLGVGIALRISWKRIKTLFVDDPELENDDETRK